MKIIFMGTPAIAIPSLQDLLKTEHEIVAIYTKAPSKKGRGHQVQISPIHALANQNKIVVYTPKNFSCLEDVQILQSLKPDLIIVFAYGLILPASVLQAVKFFCINIHTSLLPLWRGAAPIQHAILAGDNKTGVTLMRMNEGLDTGDIICQENISLDEKITFIELQQKIAQLGSQMLLKMLENFAKISFTPQNNALATFAPKITKQNLQIDWHSCAFAVSCKVRAFYPQPGASTYWRKNCIKILYAQDSKIKSNNACPGTIAIIDNNLYIACQDHLLYVHKLQLPGKNPISAKDFINGYTVKNNEVCNAQL